MIVFPNAKDDLKTECLVASRLRKRLEDHLYTKNMTKRLWYHRIKDLFNEFDTDKSGYIDKNEFKIMISMLDIDISDIALDALFRTVDGNLNDHNSIGKISYQEFLKLVCPTINFNDQNVDEELNQVISPKNSAKKYAVI
jgi:Ca2+-binding EF-hand superfamily protein